MSSLVTVFGGTGFVGTQVVQMLADRGWRIRVASRRPKRGYALNTFGFVGQIQVMGADVTRPETIEAALQGADACVNLVGILSSARGQGFRKAHVDGSRHVAEAAARHGIANFVQMSAIGADPRSHSVYARTKAEAEAAVRERIPSAVILRPSVVFGPQDAFFNRFARMATWSPALPLIGGGKTKVQPVYVGDVAQAVVRALGDSAAAGKTFELGGPEVYSFKDLMELTLHETGRKRALVPLPFALAGLMGLGGDIQGGATSALFSLFGRRGQMSAPEPMITSDQVRLLHKDNVVADKAKGLRDLGITPTSVEAIVPSYLWLYRKGGQFAEITAV